MPAIGNYILRVSNEAGHKIMTSLKTSVDAEGVFKIELPADIYDFIYENRELVTDRGLRVVQSGPNCRR